MTDLINIIDTDMCFNDDIVRVVGTSENPYFIVADVCKILTLSNPTEVMKTIPEKWKGSIQLRGTLSFNSLRVRLIGTYEEPWFVAKDICDVLTIKDVTMALTKIPDDWKGSKVIGTLEISKTGRVKVVPTLG